MTEGTAEQVSDAVLASVATVLGIDPKRVGRKSPRFAALPAFCAHCGKKLDFYDFVTTALETGEHSKEFMIRFFDSDRPMARTMPVELLCANCHGRNRVTVSYYYSPDICGPER